MIKLNRYHFILMGLIALSVAACNNNDDVDKSVITSFEKFTFTDLPDALVVPESDEEYTFNFAFDDKQILDVNVDVLPTDESTATEGEDFDLSAHTVSVAALEKSGSFSITVHSDYEAEGDETVVLSFSGHDANGLPTPQEALVLTIKDSIYPVAVMVEWMGTFVFQGTTYGVCGNVDIDFYMTDSNGEVVDGYQGATGACPELSFTNGIGNGTYDIMANLYEGLSSLPSIEEAPMSMQVSIFKGGVVSDKETTISYNTSDYAQVPVWTTMTEDGPTINIGQIRVGGGKVTLVDPDGNDVGALDQ